MSPERFRKRIANELRSYRKTKKAYPLPAMRALPEGEQYKADLDGVEVYFEPSVSSTGRNLVWSAVFYETHFTRSEGYQVDESIIAKNINGLARAVVWAKNQIELIVLAEAERWVFESENA